MTQMTFRARLAMGWIVACAAAGASADTPLSSAEVAQIAASTRPAVCAKAGDAADASGSAEDRAMARIRATLCSCLDRTLDAWVQGAPVVTRLQATAATQGLFDTCAARNLREVPAALCAVGLDPLAVSGSPPVDEARRQARCDCMRTGLAPLTDAELAESAALSYRDFKAKVRARMEGASEPALSPSPVQAVERSCRVRDAQR